MSAETEWYNCLAFTGKAPVAQRLFRKPQEEQEAMILRLALALLDGTAYFRPHQNTVTNERTWWLMDKQALRPKPTEYTPAGKLKKQHPTRPGEWWMINRDVEHRARLLISHAEHLAPGCSFTADDLKKIISIRFPGEAWKIPAGLLPQKRKLKDLWREFKTNSARF